MFFKKEKEYDYFGFFIKNAENACEAANYLKLSLENFDRETLDQRVVTMHEIENRADNEKHDMMKHLLHEFLPPIEREDIVGLAHQLDNVVDTIDDVLMKIDMYNVTEILPGTIPFADVIVKCCNCLLEAMKEFKANRNSAKMSECIVTVNTYESEGDKLHNELIKALYRNENISATTLIAWSRIFDDLEACLDVCENCTDIIETVIMKNS
ncbi:MAG: DUF47 family protein [Clostridia bacterium]|nr:DUF47 family protein [Clostridia bacterium]